jgi:pectate lyase
VTDNYMEGNPKVTADNWAGGVQPQGGDAHIQVVKLAVPWKAMPIRQQTAEEAYRLVLQHAGASLPKRDSIDARIVEEVRTGTARFGETYGGGRKGIINSQTAVGGWPHLESRPAPPDNDGDGMPDAWESRYGLDAHDVADGYKDQDGDGYTNIEEYLNGTDPTAFVDYKKAENNVNTLSSRVLKK